MGLFSLGGIYQLRHGLSRTGPSAAVRSTTVRDEPRLLTPPSSVSYYYTARDAFRTDDIKRTDLSLSYSLRIANTVEIFVQPQVLNVFNNQGKVIVDQTVNTRVSQGSGNTFLDFNPFTTIPIQRPYQDKTNKTSNWDLGPRFGNWTSVRLVPDSAPVPDLDGCPFLDPSYFVSGSRGVVPGSFLSGGWVTLRP